MRRGWTFSPPILKLAREEKKDFIKLRIGRQELNYGSGRLVSVREGPNVRQSFDGFKIRSKFHAWSIDGRRCALISTSPTSSTMPPTTPPSSGASILPIQLTRLSPSMLITSASTASPQPSTAVPAVRSAKTSALGFGIRSTPQCEAGTSMMRPCGNSAVSPTEALILDARLRYRISSFLCEVQSLAQTLKDRTQQ